MEVKPGFKLTEIGIIPEDWVVSTLGEAAKVITGRTPPTNDPSNYGYEYLFVCPADLGSNKYVVISEKYLSQKGFNNAVHIPKNSILVTCIGSTIGKVGISGLLLSTNQQINSLIPAPAYDMEYLYYTVLHNAAGIKSAANEQAVPIINKSSFSRFKAAFAPKNEQQEIVIPLKDIDSLITSLEKLIEKKKNIKQGVMQELLTGKRRLPEFTGEWEKTNVESCFDVLKGKGLSKSQLSSSGHYMCILYGELFTTYTDVIEVVASSTDSNEGIDSVAGDILLPGSTTTTGIDLAKASALMMDDVRLGGDINILRPTRNIDSSFLAMYLNTVKRNKIAEKTKGITIHHLHGNDLKDVLIELPTFMEQISISSAIITMHKEVRSLENLLSKYKLIKDGMMQELLTGRIRLI